MCLNKYLTDCLQDQIFNITMKVRTSDCLYYQQKTISTTLSTKQIAGPSIHNYHQYDSLLRYITSFITDFKLHIVQLKQIIYELIGIDVNKHYAQFTRNYANCESCQVQYMMHSCRKAREDVVRILSILRGVVKSSGIQLIKQRVYNQKQARQQRNRKRSEQGMTFKNKNKNQKQRRSSQVDDSKQNNFDLANNQIGFLTFRQIKTTQNAKNWEHKYRIQQQLDQSSCSIQPEQSQLPTPSLETSQIRSAEHDSYFSEQGLTQVDHNSLAQGSMEDSKQYFNRAFILLSLIKQQFYKTTKAQQLIKHVNNLAKQVDWLNKQKDFSELLGRQYESSH